MKSASQYSFARVPQANISRSSFRRNMTYKTTLPAGYLVPIYVDEVLPGDTFNLNVTAFARLATPIVPIMDNLYIDFFFFYVPNRLLWSNWEHLCGARDAPVADYNQDTDYLCPVVKAGSNGFAALSLEDYFGLPLGVGGLEVAAFHHRAYNLVWNEWFRDENLQQPVEVPLGDGPDDPSKYTLLRRGKRHDYFTSCLPWLQKGPDVSISLLGSAPVKNPAWEEGTYFNFGHTKQDGTVEYSVGTLASSSSSTQATAAPIALRGDVSAPIPLGSATGNLDTSMTGYSPISIGLQDDTGLEADLSHTSVATIADIRTAFQLQKLFERDARGGTRYTELLLSHFGVVSPDARLQRPEYLGGGEMPVNIHSVAQTSATGSDTPQGNLAAYGVAGGNNVGFSKSFVEHGVILGLAAVRADLTYQQGLHRMWSRRSRFDFYWPALACLSEQAVLSKEIYCDGSANDEDVFGYQERWAEYRYGVSRITGELRSTYAQSLDVWHLSQYFSQRPVLNASFIQDDPPLARVQAVSADPVLIYDSLISLNCVRCMPTFSVPGLVDHF